MKEPSRGLALSASIALLAMALAGPANGQTVARAKAAAAPKYDIAREVTIEGTVASVVTAPSPGMLSGAHAILTTPTGTVDAHLGNYALRGARALSLASGERVKMLGVMTITNGRPVLLVRTAQTGSGLYTIRNTRGFLIRSGSASAIPSTKAANGGRS
ncbi:MAG: hypothetical protein ABR951_04360 [Candidatus Aminicenantales bacterium]|jgi:hypothetical protein